MKKKKMREREREITFFVWEIYVQNVSEWQIYSKMMGIRRAKKGKQMGKIICKVKTAQDEYI